MESLEWAINLVPSAEEGAMSDRRGCRGRTTILLPLVVLAAMTVPMGCSPSGDGDRPDRPARKSLAGQVPDTAVVNVYAAASLADAIGEVGQRFAVREKVRVLTSFADSATLVRQVRNGAPADLLVPVGREWLEELEGEGLLEPGTRRDLLANRLVLVAPRQAPLEVRLARDFDLPGAFRGRLAVADPREVPAGMYARQACEAFGWWDSLGGRLVVVSGSQEALAKVEQTRCPLGAVYRTDALGSERVAVVAEFPEKTTGPIVLPVAVVAGRMRPEVRAFLLDLFAPEAREIFTDRGFRVLAPGPGAPDLVFPDEP
jgi:molybdate transport system substrate-binding protein